MTDDFAYTTLRLENRSGLINSFIFSQASISTSSVEWYRVHVTINSIYIQTYSSKSKCQTALCRSNGTPSILKTMSADEKQRLFIYVVNGQPPCLKIFPLDIRWRTTLMFCTDNHCDKCQVKFIHEHWNLITISFKIYV
jgi:hypothetical protein